MFNKSGCVIQEFGADHLISPWNCVLLPCNKGCHGDKMMAVSDPGDNLVKVRYYYRSLYTQNKKGASFDL